MNKKVSIIIPIYNSEKYLKKCIESILNQTYKNFEVILVDDGSNDNSKAVCDKYSTLDKRIWVYTKENGGVSTARNLGLKYVSGEYTIFVDSDDWLKENTLKEMVKYIEMNNSDIAIAGRIIDSVDSSKTKIKNLGKEYHTSTKKELGDSIYYLNKQGEFDVLWNKIYRTALIKKIGVEFDISATTSQDLLFNVEVFKSANSVQLINNAYYYYVKRNEESIVTRYHYNIYNIMMDRNKALKELFQYFELKSIEHEKWLAQALIRTMHVTIINLFRKGSNLSYQEKIQFIDSKIIKNIEIDNAIKIYKANNMHDKFFTILYKTQRSKVIITSYSILLYFRKKFSVIYNMLISEV